MTLVKSLELSEPQCPSSVKQENAVVAVRIECVHVKLAGVWHSKSNQYMVVIVIISWA